MEHIKKQHVRVFAMFATAFYMTGLAFVYSAIGNTVVALASVLSTLVFLCAIFQEARRS